MTLSQLTADQPFIADAGLETVLIYLDGIDLPDFASFPLLDTAHGCDTLIAYYTTSGAFNNASADAKPSWAASVPGSR